MTAGSSTASPVNMAVSQIHRKIGQPQFNGAQAPHTHAVHTTSELDLFVCVVSTELQFDLQIAILCLQLGSKKNLPGRVLIVSTVPLVKLKAGSLAQLFHLPDSQFVISTLGPENCYMCLLCDHGLDHPN